MKEGEKFSYDGIKSEDMGLYNINIDQGLLEEPFLAEREIEEIEVAGREKPYFQRIKRNPLSFTLSFAFKDNYDKDKIREVARWLDQDYYKPFYTLDNPNRIFYCILNSESILLHNGLKQGYVEIEMRCDSPYTYTPEKASKTYDWSNTGLITINQESQNDFEDWDLDNVIADSNNNLKLNTEKLKFKDIPLGTKWGEI